MTADDDDALSWADGTDDTTHVDGRGAAVSPVEIGSASSAGSAPATGSVMLVIYGILAGAYLLFTIGWILAAFRDTYSLQNLFLEIMYQLGQFLAIVAPVLWFATTFVLTRRRIAFVRVVWLVIGAVVLAPWPFILGAVP